jgi:hypothetical protein
MTDAKCVLHKVHLPNSLELQVHHEWPLGMGGPDIETNRRLVCPTGHRNVHAIIRLLVDDQPVMIGSRSERAMARAGVDAWVTAGKPGKPE